MRIGLLGDMRRWSAIVFVVFSRGGLAVSKLSRVELIGMGEEIGCLGNFINLNFRYLVHMLEF